MPRDGFETARKLLNRSLADAPFKSQIQVLLDCSRLEEIAGRYDRARQVLRRARRHVTNGNVQRHEWKVLLESILLEVRGQDIPLATVYANNAVNAFQETGRLWAILVQLKHKEGERAQHDAFRTALRHVPKSGEVWCEGARMFQNPLWECFNIELAKRCLDFAILFTPQHGDPFIEAVRLQLVVEGLGESAPMNASFHHPDEGPTTVEGDARATAACLASLNRVNTSDLERRCVNADPNYGILWFHCKRKPLDTAKEVLRVAKKMLRRELSEPPCRELYLKALRRARGQRGRGGGEARRGGEDAFLSEVGGAGDVGDVVATREGEGSEGWAKFCTLRK